MRKFWISFVLVNLLLSSYFIDQGLTPNPTSRALPVLSLFEKGTLQIDSFKDLTTDKSLVNGHYYSDKAPLTTFLLVPVYAGMRLLGLDELPGAFRTDPVFIAGDLLCGTLPFLFLVLVCFISIRDEKSSVSPVLLATVPLYGSFLFAFAFN